MRNLQKLCAAILAITLVLTSATAVFASNADINAAKEAKQMQDIDLYRDLDESDLEDALIDPDWAAVLWELRVYEGQDADDPSAGLGNALTTQDSLIFMAKIFGYNDAANALTKDQIADTLAKFDDADSISEYARNVVAYSAANGILNGSAHGDRLLVGAQNNVTSARFAAFMLKQMGYDVPDYRESVAQLSEVKGSKVDAAMTGDLTKGDAVGIMYGALTAEKANGKIVIDDIIGNNTDLRVKAEKLGLIVELGDPAVESVKALNCKQIEVKFNQKMDRNSAELSKYYEIYDNGSSQAIELSDSSASLGADGKTVTITLNKNIADKLTNSYTKIVKNRNTGKTGLFTNSSEAKVIVKKGIKAKSDRKLAEDAVFEEVAVKDGITPTVKEVKATGERNIRITFSEPVYDNENDNIINTANFKVERGTYTYTVQKATLDNNVIDLEVGTKLIEGPVTVTVNAAGLDKADKIIDYGGNAVLKGDHTFGYYKDISVPVVTVKSANRSKVVLNFSKPVKGTDIKLYHSVKNAENYKAIASATELTDEITFTYDSDTIMKLPNGPVKLFLVNSGDDNKKLVDGWGIKVPDQTLTCTIADDVSAPVFTSGDFDKNVSITLTFDEELDTDIAKDTDNYEIKRVKDNKVISFSTRIDPLEAEAVTLLPNPKLDDNTEYQVLIKKAQDIYGNKTSKQYTYTFTTGDNTAPVVINDPNIDPHCYAISQDGKITIVFSEPMNEEQMLDIGNYAVSIDRGFNYKFLGNADSITKVDNRTVTIYFSELDNKNDPTIRPYVKIAPIMDLSGKRLGDSIDPYLVANIISVFIPEPPASSSSSSSSQAPADNTPPEVVNGEEDDQRCCVIAGTGKIYIVFSEAMSRRQMIGKQNYQISLDDGESFIDLDDDDTITSVSDRIIEIYFKDLDELTDEGIHPYVKIAPITDLAGNYLYGSNEPYIVENIKPENVYFESVELIAKDRIKVVFNKKMEHVIADILSTSPSSVSVTGCESVTVYSNGITEAVFILNKELTTDAKDAGTRVEIYVGDDPTTVTEWGSRLTPGYYGYPNDKVPPEIVLTDHDYDASTPEIPLALGYGGISNHDGNDNVDEGTTGTIKLSFTENISEDTLTTDTFRVAGFTVTQITADNDRKVFLEIRANADNTSVKTTVTQVADICDASNNVLAPGTTWEIQLLYK